jgi:hypothetical protein
MVVACEPPSDHSADSPAGQDSSVIGTLDILGAEAYLNGKLAKQGGALRSGDALRTGPFTQVKIHLVGGGVVHLDEQTDPIFKELVESGKCILEILSLNRGQMFVRTGRCKARVNITNGIFEQSGTEFVVSVRADLAILTVLDGRMRLLEPKAVSIESGMEIQVSSVKVESLRHLTDPELKDSVSWRRSTDERSDPEPDPGTDPWCGQFRRCLAETARLMEEAGGWRTDIVAGTDSASLERWEESALDCEKALRLHSDFVTEQYEGGKLKRFPESCRLTTGP